MYTKEEAERKINLHLRAAQAYENQAKDPYITQEKQKDYLTLSKSHLDKACEIESQTFKY